MAVAWDERSADRIADAVKWVERDRSLRAPPSGPGHSVEPVYVRTTSGTADGDGHYPGVITLYSGNAAAWTEYSAVKLRPPNGETLTDNTRYAARPAGRTSGGDELYTAMMGPGGGGGITVREVDLTPSYSGITTLEFDQADGITVTNPSAGVARIDITAAAALSVWEIDNSTFPPEEDTVTNVTAIIFVGDDGFEIPGDSTLTAVVSLNSASPIRNGKMDTETQGFSGAKQFFGGQYGLGYSADTGIGTTYAVLTAGPTELWNPTPGKIKKITTVGAGTARTTDDFYFDGIPIPSVRTTETVAYISTGVGSWSFTAAPFNNPSSTSPLSMGFSQSSAGFSCTFGPGAPEASISIGSGPNGAFGGLTLGTLNPGNSFVSIRANTSPIGKLDVWVADHDFANPFGFRGSGTGKTGPLAGGGFCIGGIVTNLGVAPPQPFPLSPAGFSGVL